jgi:hypothetical protein
MSSSEVHSYLLYALRRALRPIARLLIRAGVRFDEFAHLARGVYVETAIRDSHAAAGIPSRARIAVVTGITRRSVDNYINNEGTLPLADPTLAHLATEVLQKWHSIPEYAGPYGIPLDLEFDAPADRCIRGLVTLVMPEADPHAVLGELLHTGAVAQSGDRHFRAVSRSFMIPDPASPQVIEHIGRTMSRLAATLEYNMDPRFPEKRLERRVAAARGLAPEQIPEFEKFARDRAIDFLVELDNWLAPYASDEADDSERVDAGVNVFLYVESRANEGPVKPLIAPSSLPRADKNLF